MRYEKTAYNHPQTGERIVRDIPVDFHKPWRNFTLEAKEALDNIIVSFKQNLRVINKATNRYEKWVDKDGIKTKEIHEQNGINWAIRKPMHKETVSGRVDLPRIKVPKGKVLTATRKSLDTSFNFKTIESITDTGIQKILKNFLVSKGSNSEVAFSSEGIEEMNNNIDKYNDGKFHHPIYKVRMFELGSKFILGQTGNKKDKYVEAAKGTNLFFAIYADKQDKRTFESIALNQVIERQKQGLNAIPQKNDKGHDLLFDLSPNDLIYVRDEEEKELVNYSLPNVLNKEFASRIYKIVSFTGGRFFIVSQSVSTSIVNKVEFTSLNKTERTLDGIMAKEFCVKLSVDRLGSLA